MHNSNAILCISLPIGVKSFEELDSSRNKELLISTKYWITESAKTLRRYISSCKLGVQIDELEIVEWNKHGEQTEVYKFLHKNNQLGNIGLVSDAGMPGIADPGALAIAWAHQNGLKVIPITGPSSIFLAMAASGLNGQSFKFNGYLPVKTPELKKKMANMVSDIKRDNTAQLFIETPYRNKNLFEELLNQIPNSIALCLAFDIQGEHEFIETMTLTEWKKKNLKWPKAPCVFILGNFLQR